MSALRRDIRKTPVHTPRHSRRSSSHFVFTNASSKNTLIEASATAAHELTDGFDSSTTAFSRTESGVASLPKKKFGRTKSSLSIEPIGGERYWSEFNDDDSEEPYTILVKHRPSSDDGYDDGEDLTLSGFIHKGFASIGRKLRVIFGISPAFPTERDPLMRKIKTISSSETSSEIDVEASVLSSPTVGTPRYDTFSQPTTSRAPLSPIYLVFLSCSIIILVLTLILALNSSTRHKHKWRTGQFTLDIEVCGAVLTALLSASVGLVVFLRSHRRVSFLHQTLVWLAFGAVCIGGGVVLAMVGNREVGN